MDRWRSLVAWDALLDEELDALGGQRQPAPGLAGHPLLDVPADRYRWYSENTYNAREETVAAHIRDFAAAGGHEWAARRRGGTDWLRYVRAGYVAWRSFRLAEARPFLERIAASEPARADSHFYLGQLCQDGLGRPAEALPCYQTFLAHAPRRAPPNNFFIDGWFSQTHAYLPGAGEALVNCGIIYREHYGDAERAGRAWRQAIDLAPTHHLAPHMRLAALLLEQGAAPGSVLPLHAQAEANYLATPWAARPYDEPCPYYPRLERWAAQRYPFSYRYFHAGLTRFIQAYDELGGRCEQAGDERSALVCFGRARRLIRRFGPQLPAPAPRPAQLRHAELALRRGDPWQAAALCAEILRSPADAGDARAAAALLALADQRRG